MFFIAILILTTLMIAGSAAFFSIYGLAQIFTGAFWPVVIMASSLEIGKLVAASYLYRYWEWVGFFRKTYLMLAILVLMGITSAGIFGFLSSAYQEDVMPLEEMETQIVLFEERKIEIKELKQERIGQRARLDAQIDAIPGNHSTNRRKMRAEQAEERKQIDLDLKRFAIELQTVTEEHHKVKKAVIQQKVHTGPIIFIAKALNQPIDNATTWMILLIIFAFDPLAVALTIGANDALIHRKGGSNYMIHKNPEGDVEVSKAEEDATVPDEEPLVVNTAMSVEELEEMLDAINTKHGNDPQVRLQKTLVEEMLAKKKVTERVRNPQKDKE